MIFRPTKHDLRQIKKLVDRGCSEPVIQDIIDISPAEWMKWRLMPAVSKILASHKQIQPEKFTVYHPDIADKVEVAFEVNLVKFYRFTKEHYHPAGRYKYVYKFLRENDLKMDIDTLQAYVKSLKMCLSGGTKGQEINLGHAWQLLHNMDTRATLPFEPEGIKRLASVVYFTDQEDLSTYDYEEGKRKIAMWEEAKVHDFFLTAPISELLGMNSSSLDSLVEYLNQANQILEDLRTSEAPTQ